MVSEDLTTNIAIQNANDNGFSSAVNNLAEENYAAVCFPLHDTPVNASTSSARKFPLPRIDTGRSTATVIQMSLQIELVSAVTGTYRAKIVDGVGTQLQFTIVSITSPDTTGYGVLTFSRVITTVTSGSAADTGQDYFVEVTSTNPATIKKAFVTLWIK
jgi:hypothetical protein